jgi:hypothetical protein
VISLQKPKNAKDFYASCSDPHYFGAILRVLKKLQLKFSVFCKILRKMRPSVVLWSSQMLANDVYYALE